MLINRSITQPEVSCHRDAKSRVGETLPQLQDIWL